MRYSPEVVAANETLKASTDGCVSVVLTKLHVLVDPTVAITKVGGLGITTMKTEALGRAIITCKERMNKMLQKQ